MASDGGVVQLMLCLCSGLWALLVESTTRSCFAKAYIDLTKAYDSVNRGALWKVLHMYGVHRTLIALLADLHSGTYAAVRVGGRSGPAFEVTAGVRQGCVAAPMLFNIFLDFVTQEALRSMPQECGIHIEVQQRQDAAVTMASGKMPAPRTVERIVMLLYADDMVLMSHDPAELTVMLQAMDKVAARYGLSINAAKTEIQVQWPVAGEAGQVPSVTLSGGAVKAAEDLKYLGSWVQQDGGMSKEIEARRAKGVGVFQSFDKVWSSRKLRLKDKMAVYNTFVLPHFLYGAEMWNCTAEHLSRLETAHSACLRRIMGVSVADRHTLQHIRTTCGSESLALTSTHDHQAHTAMVGACHAHASRKVPSHGVWMQT